MNKRSTNEKWQQVHSRTVLASAIAATFSFTPGQVLAETCQEWDERCMADSEYWFSVDVQQCWTDSFEQCFRRLVECAQENNGDDGQAYCTQEKDWCISDNYPGYESCVSRAYDDKQYRDEYCFDETMTCYS
jgi:hypothetical protein